MNSIKPSINRISMIALRFGLNIAIKLLHYFGFPHLLLFNLVSQ